MLSISLLILCTVPHRRGFPVPPHYLSRYISHECQVRYATASAQVTTCQLSSWISSSSLTDMDSTGKELTIPVARRGRLFIAQLQKRHISSSETEELEYGQQFLRSHFGSRQTWDAWDVSIIVIINLNCITRQILEVFFRAGWGSSKLETC